MTEPNFSGVPWRSPNVLVILGAVLVGVMDISLISPILPAIRDNFGVTDAQVSLIIAVYTFPGIVLAPFAGIIADRYGRRTILIPSLFVYGFVGSSIAFAPDFRFILFLRFLQGIAASSIIGLGLTLVGDFYEGIQRSNVMGAAEATIILGSTVFPVIGGTLGTVSWNLPFLMYAASIGVGAYALVALAEPEYEPQRMNATYFRTMATHVISRKAIVLYAVVFVVFLVYLGAYRTAIPFLLSRSYSLNTAQIGVVLAVTTSIAAVVSFRNGQLAARFSPRKLLVFGLVGYGLGLLGVGVILSLWVTIGALLVFGVGHGLLIPSQDTAISRLAPTQFRGGVMALRVSMVKLGQSVGPVLFAAAGARSSYPTVLLVAGVLLVATGGIGYQLVRA